MTVNQKNSSPTFQLCTGGSPIKITFSDAESRDVKDAIREILTASYGERIRRRIEGHKKSA